MLPDTATTLAHAWSPDEALRRLASTLDGLSDDPLGTIRSQRALPLQAEIGVDDLLNQLRSVVVLLLVAAAGVALVMRDLLDTAALVVATGTQTELGRIGALVGAVREERTPIERRLDALGRRLVWLAPGSAPWSPQWRRFGDSHSARCQMIDTGIALAIAAVPEGLPAVATIALAVGVRRMPGVVSR